MERGRKLAVVATALLAAFVISGCGSMRETLPARSAMEQLVISTSADRAVDSVPAQELDGKKVFVDASNLEATDKAYVIQCMRDLVLDSNGVLVKAREDADLALEVASGALSLNKRDYLFGLPAIPLPIPGGGESWQFPEIPLFKAIFYRGKAKLRVSAVDAKASEKAFEIPMCYGQAYTHFWWILLFGPFETSDLPEEIQ